MRVDISRDLDVTKVAGWGLPKIGRPCLGVLTIRNKESWVYVRAPDFWKPPFRACKHFADAASRVVRPEP